MSDASLDELLTERAARCPCCGERFTALLDWSAGESSYVEDCPVCCRPLRFDLRRDADGGFSFDLFPAD